jgi:hypothetical protein
VAPVGGRVEPTVPVRRLPPVHGRVDLPQPAVTVPGLRRTAVVIVRGGDYQILQAPVGVTAAEGTS